MVQLERPTTAAPRAVVVERVGMTPNPRRIEKRVHGRAFVNTTLWILRQKFGILKKWIAITNIRPFPISNNCNWKTHASKPSSI